MRSAFRAFSGKAEEEPAAEQRATTTTPPEGVLDVERAAEGSGGTSFGGPDADKLLRGYAEDEIVFEGEAPCACPSRSSF
jgi:hypothetical protein